MDEAKSLRHSKWECKYHVVFIPKYRRKVLYGQLRRYLGEVFHRLAGQKESRIEEGHLMVDHVHSVPRSGGHQEGEATCCMQDEGRPLGLGFQGLGSNRSWVAPVKSRGEKRQEKRRVDTSDESGKDECK